MAVRIGHLAILNDERFSAQRLRMIHNTALDIVFLNCTATPTCKYDMSHLVAILGGGAKCTSCSEVYDDHDQYPVLREHPLDSPTAVKWYAAWLGVEERYITVTPDET